MNSFLTFMTCLIGLCPADDAAMPAKDALVQGGYPALETQAGAGSTLEDYRARIIAAQINPSTPSGNYLTSRFAQRHHNWKQATKSIDLILEQLPEDLSLKKRVMVLAMGAGDYPLALRRAKDVLKDEPNNALALLFTAMEEFKATDYVAATRLIDSMPEGSLSGFVVPLLHSWSQASVGAFDTNGLQNTAVHIYHAMLIADYMDKPDTVAALSQGALNSSDMTTMDLERIGDVFSHIGQYQDAKDIYEKIMQIDPDNMSVSQKLDEANARETFDFFNGVTSPEEGMARTMFDMARLLYADYSDESAKIFANIALYLDNDMPDTRLLLGYIAARNDRFDEAISYYDSIGADDRNYFEARRKAADLLEENGRIDDALAALQELVATHDDIESLVQIGDIYRRNEQFKEAISVYNQAEKKLGGDITIDFWQIHYVRGMSYEQVGDWDRAEQDLKAALDFYPEHPFVLNYLGYSWADQGVNLKQSLAMIRKAAALRPQDGYITDSLGWVLYRMHRYAEAVPHLERAVELLPYDPVINDHLGDAYWQVGRVREARFQWQRAINHSDDEALITAIEGKFQNGLSAIETTQEAKALLIEDDSSVRDALD